MPYIIYEFGIILTMKRGEGGIGGVGPVGADLETGPEQEPRLPNIIELTPKKHTLEVDPMGCRVKRLMLGGVEVAWSGTRPDGKQGSWHPCFPYFARYEGSYIGDEPPPFHGPARSVEWEEVGLHPSTLIYELDMEEIPGAYPKGIHMKRVFNLSESGLVVSTHVANSSDQPVSVNPGEHVYLNYPAEKRHLVSVNGEDTVFVLENGVEIDLWEGSGTLIDVPRDNSAHLPGLGTLNWWQEGFDSLALWTQTGAQEGQPSANFVCIEPVNNPKDIFRSGKILLPGRDQTFKFGLDLIGE